MVVGNLWGSQQYQGGGQQGGGGRQHRQWSTTPMWYKESAEVVANTKVMDNTKGVQLMMALYE